MAGPAASGGGVLPGASASGGSAPSTSDDEIDLPINATLPTVDASVSVPTTPINAPCGYAIATIPGVDFPATLSLGSLLAYLGLPIPMIEVPPMCPELKEALLVAAVKAYRSA